jgi:hypothetical protein
MRLDIKSVVVGVVLGIVLIMALGSGKTNIEKQIEAEVASRWGRLRLVEDANGDAVAVNLETAKAKRVQFEEVNRPANTVKLRPVAND